MPLFGGTIAFAWAGLLVWSVSPYARFLDHDWTRLGLAAGLCSALPAGTVLVPGLLYVGGWVLMTAAMMLPTTMPLVSLFRRLTARRSDAAVLTGLLLAGYLAAWLGFGLAAHMIGLGVLALAGQSPWLTFNGWLIGAVILFLAGLFQFSSLKYRCLDACRSPLPFLLSRWHGLRPRLESVRLGFAHGVFCVGCCWLLMMLMFVVGTGNVVWMLSLGALMALEKNSPWGRKLAAPLGAALLTVALVVAVQGAAPRFWP